MRATFKNKGAIWMAGAGLLGLVIVVALMLWMMSIMVTGDGTSKNVYQKAYDEANKVKTAEENRGQHLLDNAGGQPTAAPAPTAAPSAAPSPSPKTRSAGGHVKVPAQAEDHGATDLIKEMEK